MSFVDWTTITVLLVVGLGGIYGGLTSLAGRKVKFAAFRVEGRGTLLMALLYFAASVVSFLALAGLLTPNP